MPNINPATEITLQSLAKEFIDAFTAFHPVDATNIGIHQFDDRLSHYSTEEVTTYVKTLQNILSKAEQIKPEPLPIDEQIDRELLIANLKMELFQFEKLNHWQQNPNFYVDECIQGIYLLLLRDFAPLSVRAKNIAKRFAEVPRVLDEASQNIKNPSRTHTIAAIEELKTGETFFDQTTKELSKKIPELKQELLAGVKPAIKAMRSYQGKLKKLLPFLKADFAIGKDNFDYMLKTEHFLLFDSDSLLRIGEDALAKADFAINALRNRKQDYEMTHPKPEKPELIPPKDFSKPDILAYEASEIDSMKEWVSSHGIATVPDYLGKLVVVETPIFLRPILPGLAMRPAAIIDSVQTSYLYIPPIPDRLDAEAKNYYYNVIKYRQWKGGVVHEGYPGHHFQLSLANHQPSLIRKLQWNTTIIEGWALYCEQMVADQRLYPDDLFSDLRWLGGEKFRAARIILDVKLQTGKMTFDEAVNFLVDNFGPDTAYYQAEVRRYCLTPTQPMSYLVGKRQILELRDEYRKKMGNKYSLKDFHDKLLAEGSIPINLIQKKLLN